MNDPAPADSSFMLAAKVQAPSVAPGYFRRTDLVERVEPLRRLTVVRTPSGFGKTCLLADVFHRWQEQGRLAAWLAVDEDDAPGVFDAYLAYAFKVAGLSMTTVRQAWRGDHDEGPRPRRRTELLAASIGAHGTPCLLVLDEVERMSNPRVVASVNFLLLHGPRNLHVALGMRENPGLAERPAPECGAARAASRSWTP